MKVLLVGNSARAHIIAEKITRSRHKPELFAFMSANNPGIASLAEETAIGKLDDISSIVSFAAEKKADFAVISPELPLSVGVVDALEEIGIPSFGPCRKLAALESSKAFVLDIMDEFKIPGAPKYRSFSTMDGIEEYILELGDYVLKPDGLTGGKGVMVSGEHINSLEEALDYCREVISRHGKIVIEEKLEGEEFSLMSFSDGHTVIDMPPVQDHKRAYEGDTGPNTGGMGSYSDAGNLPFLEKKDLDDAHAITEAVNNAMSKKYGLRYKGVMYGGFMATKDGVRLIEYNARFGDPEAMNVLSLLKTDFIDLCLAIINERLATIDISFENKATVCKYLVPSDYPGGNGGGEVDATNATLEARIYYASVDSIDGKLILGKSRAIAVVGVAGTLGKAEKIAEDACNSIEGNVRHRKDIGTEDLVKKRITHMQRLRTQEN